MNMTKTKFDVKICFFFLVILNPLKLIRIRISKKSCTQQEREFTARCSRERFEGAHHQNTCRCSLPSGMLFLCSMLCVHAVIAVYIVSDEFTHFARYYYIVYAFLIKHTTCEFSFCYSVCLSKHPQNKQIFWDTGCHCNSFILKKSVRG